MIIESGLIVAAGLLLMFWKTKWSVRMKMLSHPVAMDVFIFIALTWLHWGTYTGVMVAATGALVCSGMLSLGRYAFGYVEKRAYVPGVWNVGAKL